jgi:hypothetical protein
MRYGEGFGCSRTLERSPLEALISTDGAGTREATR